MIYLAHTLKQIGEKTISKDIYIEAEDDALIKSLMNKCKIMVLGVKTNSGGRPNSIGFFIKIHTEEKDFVGYLPSKTIDEACEICINIELPIVALQNREGTIHHEESTKIIEKYKSIYLIQQKEQKDKEKEDKQKNDKVMEDERKKKIIEIIGQTIEDINTISEELKTRKEYKNDLNIINEYKDQLTKMRMGSNIEKSTQILEKVFAVMEKIEITKINEMKTEEQQISDNSIVSNVDIIGELEKLKRAKQTHDAGTKKNKSDIYYTLFGIIGLYQKFIAKDVFNKLSQIKVVLHGFVFHGSFILLNVSIIIGLYTARMMHNSDVTNSEHFYTMITLGISGSVLGILSSFFEKNIITVLLSIVLAIVLIIIIQRLLLINLALF